MKQKDLTRAYSAIMALSEIKLPVKKAYAVYQIAKLVDEHCKFAAREEQKCFEKYSGTICDDKSVRFANEQDCDACKREIEDIAQMEVDVPMAPVIITDEDMAGQTISPINIMNLEGLVTFA